MILIPHGRGYVKYRDLLAASRSAKSRYFATTKLSFDLRVFFLLNNLLVDLSFWRNSDRKKEKRVVSFTNDPNIIFSQTHLDNIVHEQTIIWRQLFAGHVVGSRPMKRKKNLQRMIINNYSSSPNGTLSQ